jgi:2-succinyl-5-enolpyruvyl-6-hydroxy-3-cyclohexene-1-carboxylate synthase
VVLTADRPPELRGWGAAQTIDQVRLFGSHVRWFCEAPPPGRGSAARRYARALACRVVATAAGLPAGPVHVNLPFREPLDPSPERDAVAESDGTAAVALRDRAARPYTASWRGAPAPSPDLVSSLFEALAAAPRGVIVCGPDDSDPALPDAVARLARATGWPLLAEATSQVRCGPHTRATPIVTCFDALLNEHEFALAQAPDLVLRFGAPPTSKAFHRWLEMHTTARLVMLDPNGSWSDPQHLASDVIEADPVRLCDALVRRLRGRASSPGCPDWLAQWNDAEKRARSVIESRVEPGAGLLAPHVISALAAGLRDGATLFVSNSMVVRDLDAYLPFSNRRLRVLANRGANGIDGIVSSALGAAAGLDDPLVLLSGDLAFLHDTGGLFAARHHEISATLVVVNDDGGGIFSLLPIAAHGERVDFERLFTVPHGISIGSLASAYGLQHRRATSVEEFSQALESFQSSPGTQVIEVVVDRSQNLALHREIRAEIGRCARGVCA